MSSPATTFGWLTRATNSVQARERVNIAAVSRMAINGVWALFRRKPEDGPHSPIFLGTVDTRAQAEQACTTADDYFWLIPHNEPMSPDTTDDPMPFLCFPKDPKYEAQNKRERALFAALECEMVKVRRCEWDDLIEEALKIINDSTPAG